MTTDTSHHPEDPKSGSFSPRLWRALVRQSVAVAENPLLGGFCFTFIVLCTVYRVALLVRLYGRGLPPLGFDPHAVPVLAVLRSVLNDGLVLLVITMLWLGLSRWIKLRLPAATRRPFVGFACADAMLLLATLVMVVHFRLVSEFDSGLTVNAVRLAVAQFGGLNLLHSMRLTDVVALISPVLLFHLLVQLHGRWRKWLPAALGIGCAVTLILQVQPAPPIAPELTSNPIGFFLRDTLREPMYLYLGQSNPYRNRNDLPGEDQMKSIRLVDEAFVNDTSGSQGDLLWKPLSTTNTQWNILLFVLESTGADYVFDTSLGNEVPMPFLKSMAENGLWLTQHHATGNSSPRGSFGIFTGVYPRMDDEVFALGKDVALPMLPRFLPGKYHGLFVHPCSGTFSFPMGLLAHNDFDHIYTRDAIPPGQADDPTPLARNELTSIDFLMQRLDEASSPFFGIYYSYVPHHPYSDYGKEYRILPNLENRRHLYYNNLRLLDTQLQRIHDHLKATGQLEHTILVFVGDHGEGMGQHPGWGAHGYGPFSETYHVPMIFYAPALIPPRRMEQPTSHVDILPTLLDLMGVSWDQKHVQGESVLRPSVRKYIFTCDGTGGYVSAIDHDLNKVSVGFVDGLTHAYNLKRDPGEKLQLNVDRFENHINAIIRFRNYQGRMLENYNSALNRGEDLLTGKAWTDQLLHTQSVESEKR